VQPALDGGALTAALGSVRRSLVQQRRRAWVTAVVSVLALVGVPLFTVPDLLRDHRLATTGPAVEAVVLSTTDGGRAPDTAWVQPPSGPPARIGNLGRVWPAVGDPLPVVVDPQRRSRAVLAEDGPDVRFEAAQRVLLGGGLPFLLVLSWRPVLVASRDVRRGVAAAVDSASTARLWSVATSFEVVGSSFPLPRLSLSSLGELSAAGRATHHDVEVLLADGRTLSGRWHGSRLARGVRGVAVGDLDDDEHEVQHVVLVVGRHVLWPDDRPLQVRPAATSDGRSAPA